MRVKWRRRLEGVVTWRKSFVRWKGNRYEDLAVLAELGRRTVQVKGGDRRGHVEGKAVTVEGTRTPAPENADILKRLRLASERNRIHHVILAGSVIRLHGCDLQMDPERENNVELVDAKTVGGVGSYGVGIGLGLLNCCGVVLNGERG